MKKEGLLAITKLIVPSQMKHHAEAEACDLLMEVELLDLLEQYVDDAAYNRSVELFFKWTVSRVGLN
jgi:26S proteasome regulatory subunit N1